MNTRKDFLIAGSLFALAPAVAGAAAPAPQSTKAPELTFSFDRAAFDRILAKPAKHKQCFGATKIEGGSVTNGMANTMDAYEQYLGEAPGSVQTIAVLYHGTAIALAMNDAVWNAILFPSLRSAPEDLRKDFAGQKPGAGNPFAKSVAKVVARGSSFFVCHNAIAGFADMAAGALKQPVRKVHDALMAGILPGALVVPAGVMAINAAQEAKFTYIQSSV